MSAEHDASDWASGFGGRRGERPANMHDSHLSLIFSGAAEVRNWIDCV